MNKVIILELKRFIPLVLLLVLLASLSLYDYLTPEALETVGIEDDNELIELDFETEEKGFVKEPVSFQVIREQDEWAAMIRQHNLDINTEAMDEQDHTGVVALNSKITDVWVDRDAQQGNHELVVKLAAEPMDSYFQVILLNNEDLEFNQDLAWKFMDQTGDVIYQIEE